MNSRTEHSSKVISASLRLLVLASLLSAFASCGEKSASTNTLNNEGLIAQNIIGGVDASSDYQKQNGIVGLLLVSETAEGQQQSSICTASLLSENVALTAAHCLVLDEGSQLVAALVFFDKDLDVVMQQISKKDYSNVRSITKVLRHKEYLKGKTADNDLGLIRFEGKAPVGFRAARLAPESTTRALRKDSTVTLAGFGVSKYDWNSATGRADGGGDGLLRQVSGIKFLGFTPSTEEMVFDQTAGQGACHGDSGGPAYVVDQVTRQTLLIGVTSRGTEERGLCDKQAVYSSVMAYAKWISEGLKTISQDAPAVTQQRRVASVK